MAKSKKAKAEPKSLGSFEGFDVVATEIVIRKTGDGLSTAMKVEPNFLHHGDEGFVVLEYVVVDVQHPAVNREEPGIGGVKRLHILDAGTAAFIDSDLVAQVIEKQREKNERYEEQQLGQARTEDLLLIEAHDRGEHADGLVEYCPRCADEEAKAEAERAADDVAWDDAEKPK